LQSLEDDVSDFGMLQLFLHHELKDVFFHVLKNEEEVVIVLDDFVELDDIWMVQFLKNFNLIEVDAFIPVGILLLDLFDGDDLF
jgi:hypothetical protein